MYVGHLRCKTGSLSARQGWGRQRAVWMRQGTGCFVDRANYFRGQCEVNEGAMGLKSDSGRCSVNHTATVAASEGPDVRAKHTTLSIRDNGPLHTYLLPYASQLCTL